MNESLISGALYLKMAPTKIRLNHYLAKAGLTSRRGADTLVFAGHVQVNGQVIKEPGFRVTLGQDKVLCDGQTVELAKDPLRYIMLHKPIHIVWDVWITCLKVCFY